MVKVNCLSPYDGRLGTHNYTDARGNTITASSGHPVGTEPVVAFRLQEITLESDEDGRVRGEYSVMNAYDLKRRSQPMVRLFLMALTPSCLLYTSPSPRDS